MGVGKSLNAPCILFTEGPGLFFLYLGLLVATTFFLKRRIFLEIYSANYVCLDARKPHRFGTGGYLAGISTWARLQFRGNVQCGQTDLPARHPVSGLEEVSCVSVSRTPRWGNVPKQSTCISSELCETTPSTQEAPVSLQQFNGIMNHIVCEQFFEAASSKC